MHFWSKKRTWIGVLNRGIYQSFMNQIKIISIIQRLERVLCVLQM